MATTTFTSASITSDALLQTYWQNWNTAFTTVGLVYVSQTGDVNTGTVTRTGGTSYGFRVYRFNDTLQSTTPIYLKFELSCTTGASLLIRCSWGTGVNGSGTLTGQVSDLGGAGYTSSTGTSATDVRVSGDTNRLTFLVYTTFPGSLSYIVGCERLKNAAGTDLSTGYWNFVQTNLTTQTWVQTVPSSGTIPSAQLPWMLQSNSNPSSSTYGGNVFISPVFPLIGALYPPTLSLVVYCNADIVNGTTVAIPLYGTNRTFLTTPNNYSVSNGNYRYAVRYE